MVERLRDVPGLPRGRGPKPGFARERGPAGPFFVNPNERRNIGDNKVRESDLKDLARQCSESCGPDHAMRREALSKVPEVVKGSKELFFFIHEVLQHRGWGRGLRNAVGKWYSNQSPLSIMKEVTNTPKGFGFSHRDLIRLSHPLPVTEEHGALYGWILNGGNIPQTLLK